jgi:hypothetical protein
VFGPSGSNARTKPIEPAAPPHGSVLARRASARRTRQTIVDDLRSANQLAAEVARAAPPAMAAYRWA